MPILHWLNRDETIHTSSQVPYRLLKEEPELSYGDPNTENMLIQGDNLDALKSLLPYYAGKIKCIVIDPPYNTKSAFEHYDDNLEHTKWLEMMYPRLELLRELLAEDGSIWVTIDDNEAHYLKVIMDEIFGRKNFVANCVWQKKYAASNDAKYISDVHDSIICYAKNKPIWAVNLLPRSEELNNKYTNPDNDPRGPWYSTNLSVKTYSEKNDYIITSPNNIDFKPPPSRCWVVSKEKYEDLLRDNRIWFGKDGTARPYQKKFLSEVQQGTVPTTLWLHQDAGHNISAKSEIRELFEGRIDLFATPKPEKLIQRILTLATNKNDLVLDSFLGSGTTAAVAHKMNRRYIGIEMGEHAKTHCAARLKKVINGEQGGISKEVNWQGGGGFRFYSLGETIFDEQGQINRSIRFNQLAAHIWFSETRIPWQANKKNSPFLGIHNGIGYYLLYNGILGDKRPDGGNVLTSKVLAALPKHDGPKVIYGETSRVSPIKLAQAQIIFKQTPYDIKA